MQDAVTPPSFRDLTLQEFVDRLESAEPVPGGGSASAVAASLGAGLVVMVARLSLGRPKYSAYESILNGAVEDGLRLAERLLALADEDSRAYSRYAAALKLPRETEADKTARREAIRAAASGAAEVPLEVMEVCLGVATAAEALAGRSNVNASSDVGVAALLAEAAARGAAANVLINLPALDDELRADRMTVRVDHLLHEIQGLAAETRRVILGGELREPERP